MAAGNFPRSNRYQSATEAMSRFGGFLHFIRPDSTARNKNVSAAFFLLATA